MGVMGRDFAGRSAISATIELIEVVRAGEPEFESEGEGMEF